MQHLLKVSAAYSAMNSNKESEFFALKALQDHIRLLRLPKYYTLQGPSPAARQPWSYEVSIGRRYNATGHLNLSTAITFCRFICDQGKMIVRSPLSIISLLETSAMAQELMMHTSLLASLEKEPSIIEFAQFRRQTMDYLYNRHLTEYSVCAHLIANHQKASDALSAFVFSGTIARWVLNAPEPVFDRVAEHAPLGEVLGVPGNHEYVAALRDGIRGKDLGALYYAIAVALPKDSWRDIASAHSALDVALSVLGLDSTEVERWQITELAKTTATLFACECESIRRVAQAGLNNFPILLRPGTSIPFSELELPKVLLGDLVYRHTLGDPQLPLATEDPELAFNQLRPLEHHASNFAEACI
jgi:hypothetical protein